MTMLRALVTGASGRLGQYVRALFDSVDDIDGTYLAGPSHGGPDLTDADAISDAIGRAQPDAVVHLAGLIGEACAADPARTRLVNTESVGRLARAAEEAGATRFVLASSAAVYGDHATHPVDESVETRGDSPYALSKLAAEDSLRKLTSLRMSCMSLRIFNVYGEGFDGSLVNRLLNSTPETPVPLRGLDLFVRDYVHASDVAAAFASSLRTPGAFGVYNIGSGEPISNRELVTRLARRQAVYYTSDEAPASYSCADIGRAREELGYSPRLLG